MNFQTVSGWLHNRTAAKLGHRRAQALEPVPIISFTFDDFPRSALTTAGEMLERKGIRGTYYAALELAGQETSVGSIFNLDDIRSLAAHGHELACHTYAHLSAHEHSVSAIAGSCATNRQKALELLPDHPLRNFSFPFGDATLATKRQLGSVYDTLRTVQAGINHSPVDLSFLRGNPIYSWQPLNDVRRLIERNAADNGWLILYTHDVCESPSQYGCTPDYFREVVSCALGSGARVMSIGEAVRHFRALHPQVAAKVENGTPKEGTSHA
jgi:peptidoglycan/xylan/chitin deacetylase (PgdA/CDA1 family)